jgi:two-component system sensor histidine kinase KdpD
MMLRLEAWQRGASAASWRAAGIGVSVLGVAAVTGLIALLDGHVPALNLYVLYLFVVVPVAIVWGMRFAVPVAVVGMTVFEFFFVPPLNTLRISDTKILFALGTFVLTAVVVSKLAADARRRARESALLAEIASALLERGTVSDQLDQIGTDTAAALGVERARIEVGERSSDGYPLAVAGRRVGTLVLEGAEADAARRRRLVPALASLLGVAIDRERLAREALEAEALRRSDGLKTALLRSVSHDLRSPLMAIATSASTLAHAEFELPAGDRSQLLATIVAESERLDRLVGNLLDLSRLEAGAAPPALALWPVDELVVQALESVGADGLRVEVSFPDDAVAVSVDAGQIERALANLIENALKYSPPSEPVRLQVAATGTDVLVRVVDHGSGLPPAELERVFAPFERGSGAHGRPGAGLGLAIARGFAEANGGRVWAESLAGQGASFVLALPLAQVAEVDA